MKNLMLTTALVTATGFGAAAQTAMEQNAEMAPATGSQGAVQAFLVSDFTGMTLYSLEADVSSGLIGNGAAATQDSGIDNAGSDRLRWTSSDALVADRDTWSSVGSIDDVVMTRDGDIRGILVDVGGFIGLFARTVMVDVDDLYFVTDPGTSGDIDEFFVVVAMSQEQLENLPEWDESQLYAGFDAGPVRQVDDPATGVAMTDDPMSGDPAAAPLIQPDATQETATATTGEDYLPLQAEERTADRLIGAEVYDVSGENVGSVNDVVIGEDNRVTSIIVDVGGFLGIGTHAVELPVDAADIGWRDADGSVRVQLAMPAEHLEALPEYQG